MSGYPVKIIDSNNNAITLSYNPKYQINNIRDGAGRVYLLNYNGPNQQLDSIVDTGTGTTAVKTVTYRYDGERLSTITDPDAKTSRYYWNADNTFNKAVDCDNSEMRYTYTQNAAGRPSRVSTVEEFGSDATSAGGKFTFNYGFNETSVTDRDNLANTYQFNNYGNTVCIKDEMNAAQYFQFGAPGGVEANKIKSSSKLQKTTVNLLANHNFEIDSGWNPFVWQSGPGNNVASATYDATTSFIGNRSIKLQNTTVVTPGCAPQMYQYIKLQKNKTYTLSAYVKTSNLSQGQGSGAGFMIGLPGVGNIFGDFINTQSDWKRLEFTFTVPPTVSADIVDADVHVFLENVTGTAWFDCIQLEESPASSRYNLVENSSMEYAINKRPNNWIFYGNSTTDCTVNNGINKNAYKIEGSPEIYKYLYQNIEINGKANQPIVYGAWSKANSIPQPSGDRSYRIYLRVFYNDGTEELACSNFNPNSNGWQYNSSVFVPKKDFSHAYFILEYACNVNTAYFDDAQLYLEEFGESYQYDSNGNIKSTADLAQQQNSFIYDSNNNLKQLISPDVSKYDYTYDTSHNLITALSDNEIKYSFTYDSYGNPLSSQTESVSNSNLKISTSASYTANGNYISAVTDSRGKITSYNYDQNKGTLSDSTLPGETDSTKTNYTYDNNDTLTNVSKTFSGRTFSNSYTYTNDKLSAIQQNGYAYNFEYDVFGNLKSTKVGTQSLITNSYLPNNGLLSSSTYGNEQTVGYTYDVFKRIIGKSINGAEKFKYLYDNEGNLNKYTDNVLNQSYTHSYDLIGRLSNVKGTNGHNMYLRYDTKNRLSTFTNKYGNSSFKTEYVYGNTVSGQKPGLIYGIKINDSQKLSYNYDNLARLNSKTIATTQPFNASYTYESGSGITMSYDSTKTTNRVVNGDYNGDGKNDIAALYDCDNGQTKIYVWLSNGTSYNNPVVWWDSGRNNVVASNVSGRVVSGDYNGDGKDDIAVMYDYGNSTSKFIVFISAGSSFTDGSNGWYWFQSGVGAYNANLVTNRMVSGDFNGDGKDDIATMYDYGAAAMQMHVFLSNGSSFSVNSWIQANTGNYDANLVTGRMVAGDFNGDGKDDVAAMYDYGNAVVKIHSFLSTGSLFTCQTWYDGSAHGYYFIAENVKYRMVAGDLNNDGKDDISTLYDYGNKSVRLISFKSAGTSFPLAQVSNSNYFTCDPNKITGRLVAGDYNNDGIDEVTGLSENGANSTKIISWDFNNNTFSDARTLWDSNNIGTVTENQTTTLIKTIKNGNDTTSYTYDDRGNISTISENGILKASYTYDLLNQLTREDNAYTGKSIDYVYDLGGNIDYRDEYEYANGVRGNLIKRFDYSYDNVWKDKLVSYDGKAITYDEIGNPLSFDGRTFTWQAGRQLASTTKDGITSSYTYNDNGIRTSKTVNGVTTTYYLNGDSVVREQNSTDTIDYYYDDNDTLFGFNINGTDYYYIRNAQNDIIGILDNAGNQVVTYTYDSWGKLISISGSLASTVGEKNPYRYKGYRYDTETSLYYLNLRYYNPEMGRFINADEISVLAEDQDSLLENNLFAYCLNNPVNMSDPSGHIAANIIGGIAGGASGALLGVLLAKQLRLTGWKKAALISAATVGGAALGAFLGPYVAKLGANISVQLGISSIPKIGSQIGRLGKLVKNSKPMIKGLTRHGLQRMQQRGVSKSLAQTIIRKGYAIEQSAGKTLFFTKAGAVVLNKTGEVVTAYSSKYFDSAMQQIVKQFYR